MSKRKRKIKSSTEARKGTQEAPKMSKHDPEFVSNISLLFEF